MLVQCIFEGLGVLCIDYFFWEPIPIGGHSESEEVFSDIYSTSPFEDLLGVAPGSRCTLG